MENVKLYTLSEVAEKTGLSLRALSDAARANKMEHYKVQGKRYMSQSQIEAYLAQQVVKPTGLEAAIMNQARLKEELLRTGFAERTRRSQNRQRLTSDTR